MNEAKPRVGLESLENRRKREKTGVGEKVKKKEKQKDIKRKVIKQITDSIRCILFAEKLGNKNQILRCIS